MQYLAGKLGMAVAICEPEPGRWITKAVLARDTSPAAEMLAASSDDRPPLPEELRRLDLPTFAEARALRLSLKPQYRSQLGFDRQRERYFVTAP